MADRYQCSARRYDLVEKYILVGTLTDARNEPNSKADLKIILDGPDGPTFRPPKTNVNHVRWHRLQT